MDRALGTFGRPKPIGAQHELAPRIARSQDGRRLPDLAVRRGGKLDTIFFSAAGPSRDWDGFIIIELPDDAAAEALYMTVEATGDFQKQVMIPLVTAEQFKAAMERAQGAKTAWTPPATTK